MGKWSVINSMLNVEINPSDKMVLSRKMTIANIISLEWPPFQIGDSFLPLLLLDMDMMDMVDMVA